MSSQIERFTMKDAQSAREGQQAKVVLRSVRHEGMEVGATIAEVSDKTWAYVTVCEVYTRIVGYLRPVSRWNVGKKEEFGERQTYRFPNMEAYDAGKRVQASGEAAT